MTLENGWLQRAYTTNKCGTNGNQISEHKSQIIKAQFVSYAVNHTDQAREASFFSTTQTPVREDA
jgi:hypothetical protein